jgi:hypothetical protein
LRHHYRLNRQPINARPPSDSGQARVFDVATKIAPKATTDRIASGDSLISLRAPDPRHLLGRRA